jgi:hypothetical protein
MAKWKWDSAHGGKRCGHSYCSGCQTRRGRNRGNRRVRHAVKTLLRMERKES